MAANSFHRRILVFFWLVVSATVPLLGQDYDQPEAAYTQLPAKILKVGEAFQVNLRSGQKIFISRKGYLAIHQLSPEQFRLIALKKGELVVLVKSRADRVISQRTVLIRTAAPKLPAAKHEPLPADCRARGIHCQAGKPAIISGMASQWQQFFALRSWCKRQRCAFRLSLSPRARQRYQQFVQSALGTRFPHEVLANGVLLLCQHGQKATDLAANVRLILDGELWQLPITAQRCHKMANTQNYEIEALAFRLKDDDAERMGLNIAGQSFPLSQSHNLKLHAFLADNRSLVIGHPTLQVAADELSEFATGSEWFIANDDNKGQWKQVGFKIKLKVSPAADDRLRVWYQVEITGPKNGEATALDRSYMASTMTARLGQPQVVAHLGTAMSATGTQGIPVVDDIPIIGPLTRHKVAAKSFSRLFLWLRVRRALPRPQMTGRRSATFVHDHALAVLRHPLP